MNDTEPQITQRVRDMLMAKSGEERLKMGFSAMSMARKIVESSLRSSQPGISDSEMRQQIFLRYYADDFAPEERQKILAWLGK